MERPKPAKDFHGKHTEAYNLFCAAGGETSGMILAFSELALHVDLAAVNHWQVAIERTERTISVLTERMLGGDRMSLDYDQLRARLVCGLQRPGQSAMPTKAKSSEAFDSGRYDRPKEASEILDTYDDCVKRHGAQLRE